MARKKPKLASKKSEKSKHNKGPTTNLDFEVGELEGNVDVGLGSVGAEVELETGGLAEGTSMDIIIELDVSPIEFDLDYDPTSSELSGSIEIGLPGDLIGITGGLTVNTETGEVTAITGGVALAGLELEITTGLGKYTCRTVSTVTFFGIGYSVTQDNCKDKGSVGSEPEPTPNDITDSLPTGPPSYNDVPSDYDGWYCPVYEVCTNVVIIFKQSDGRFPDIKGYVEGSNSLPNSSMSFSSQGFKPVPAIGPYLPNYYKDVTFRGTSYEAYTEWDIGTQTFKKVKHSSSFGVATGKYCFRSFVVPDKIQPFLADENGHFHDYPVWWYPPNTSGGELMGCTLEPPPPPTPPPTPPRPRPRPRPYRRKRENPMNEDCCKAIIELLTGVANVTGVSETYSYPLPVKVKGEVVESYNLIHYHALKPGVDDVLKVIGSVPEDAGVFPIEIYVQQNPTDRRPTKIEVNNISQLLSLVGNSTGYNDVNKPVELRLNKDNRVFTYRSLGDAIRELMPVLAPHKMIYANKDNGYVVPFEQLTPQGEGYDTTKDYLGIYTRLFSSVQRYGFDSPVYIKLKDKDPNIEGDEEAGYTVLNLAGAIEKLLYYQKEIGEDIDTQTNLLIRLSFLLTRTYSMVIKSWYRITAILDGLNISVKQIAVNAVVEFNLLAGKIFKPGQGFERNNETSDKLELDLTEEDTTNKLLDKLLTNSELNLSVDKLKKNGKQK